MATKGYYMAPALLVSSHNSMSHNREEMFAPVASIQKISNYEEGLSLTNDTEFGLVAGIFTQSLARATHFRRNVETGCVTVNLPTAGTDYHVPFGGRKIPHQAHVSKGVLLRSFIHKLKRLISKPEIQFNEFASSNH